MVVGPDGDPWYLISTPRVISRPMQNPRIVRIEPDANDYLSPRGQAGSIRAASVELRTASVELRTAGAAISASRFRYYRPTIGYSSYG
jgi:hypothetical protein